MKGLRNLVKFIIIFIFILALPNYSKAEEISLTSKQPEAFKKWLNQEPNEKEQGLMPEMFSVEVPIEKKVKNNSFKNFQFMRNFKITEGELGNSYSARYNLLDEINLEKKDQKGTNQCWAFSILSSMESNIAFTKGEYKNFSERHVAYATARNFLDGVNSKGFNKKVNEYGLQTIALAYLTNGQGAVLEEKMPFENNQDEIYLEQINIPKDTYASDYQVLPSIYKNYDSQGNIIYNNGLGKIYSTEEVQNIRNIIKEHITKYGAISTVTASSKYQYYNEPDNPTKASAYYCDDENIVRDHAITIIGWDDNYSRNNFNPEHMPKSDGAYIVLNSYGENSFDNGCMYVSYEDILIETSLYGISGTSSNDYYNLYQHDYYGGIATLGTNTINTGYYANIYQRETEKEELLTDVSVTVCDYVDLNIYVNPNGEEVSKDKLVKVASTSNLTPGYHTVDIEDIQLTSNKFAIVVEQTSRTSGFVFSVETYVASTFYDVVTANSGDSKISFDGEEWEDLANFGIISGIDTSKSDVCIKGFTKEKKSDNPDNPNNPDQPDNPDIYLTSEIYNIDNGYIKNINYDTTLSKLKEELNTNGIIKVYYNEKEVEEEEKLKTGMHLKVGDKELDIVVLGDINGDGKVSLIDISKLVLHYNEDPKFILKGANKEAGDMNLDGEISLLDISKLLILYNNI